MKVQRLFEGKEENFGVKIRTKDDITKQIYFKTKDEMEAYIKRTKEKLGSKIEAITKLYKENGEWGALKEDYNANGPSMYVRDELKRLIELANKNISDSNLIAWKIITSVKSISELKNQMKHNKVSDSDIQEFIKRWKEKGWLDKI